MSELLRLANELVEARYSGYRQKGWPCIERAHCPYTDDTITVIKGYQELIRRMLTPGDSVEDAFAIIREARESIPQEPSNG